MPSPDKRVRVDIIRAAVRLAVKEKSLRAVARQVGMSAMGLSNFLDGRNPYTGTLHKLTLWYAEHGARLGAPEHTARAALGVLLDGLPQKGQARGKEKLLGLIEQLYREYQTQLPPWLTALQDGEPDG